MSCDPQAVAEAFAGAGAGTGAAGAFAFSGSATDTCLVRGWNHVRKVLDSSCWLVVCESRSFQLPCHSSTAALILLTEASRLFSTSPNRLVTASDLKLGTVPGFSSLN